MTLLELTKSSSMILGPIARILGFLMDYIFRFLNLIGIPNTGLAIILFTIVIYMCLMPLTIKQQKFSKLQNKMNPELTAIRKKYENKKDNESVAKMNAETQAVYAKYGVSPTGSCVQLLIQMPILFSLYRVIYNIPAYVTQVKEAFFPLVDNLIAQSGAAEYMQSTSAASQLASQFKNESFVNGVTEYVQNTFIDVMNKFSSADWTALAEKFPGIASDVTNTQSLLDHYNNFLGINIANSPSYTLRANWGNHMYVAAICALIIPILSAATQWLNVKLMPTAANQSSGNDQADAMMSSMKTMNIMMPLMSAYFCFVLPAGMGLYWVAGAVVRTVQQVIINKHIDKMDIDQLIKENQAKAKKKAEKRGDKPTAYEKMMSYSNMNTKQISSEEKDKAKSGKVQGTSEKAYEEMQSRNQGKTYKKGSISAKANMVRDFNNVGRKDK